MFIVKKFRQAESSARQAGGTPADSGLKEKSQHGDKTCERGGGREGEREGTCAVYANSAAASPSGGAPLRAAAIRPSLEGLFALPSRGSCRARAATAAAAKKPGLPPARPPVFRN